MSTSINVIMWAINIIGIFILWNTRDRPLVHPIIFCSFCQHKEHRMKNYSHTTDESYREGTETLPLQNRAKRKNGVPEKYCKANFLGGGETNEANLKGLLANLFLLRNLFGRAGAPPFTFAQQIYHCAKHNITAKQYHSPQANITAWNILSR